MFVLHLHSLFSTLSNILFIDHYYLLCCISYFPFICFIIAKASIAEGVSCLSSVNILPSSTYASSENNTLLFLFLIIAKFISCSVVPFSLSVP